MAAVKDMPFLAIDVLIRCSYDPREVVGQRERGGECKYIHIYRKADLNLFSSAGNQLAVCRHMAEFNQEMSITTCPHHITNHIMYIFLLFI